MTIKVGDKMPAGTFTFPGPDGPQKITTEKLFSGKTVVLVSVPGAFTPTCDARHLPGFVEHAADFKAKGVDTVACMAVNDVFVMKAWGKSSAVEDKVLMLADGNADYVTGTRPRIRRLRLRHGCARPALRGRGERRYGRRPVC